MYVGLFRGSLMRVLIVNRMLGTLLGGGETFDLNVARNLIKMGHEVTIITGKPFFSQARLSHGDLKIVYLSTPNLRFLEQKGRHISQKFGAILRHIDTYSFEWAVLRWIAKNQQAYDIVQCCGMFWLPRQILTRFSTPVVSWLPGPPSKLTLRLIRALVSHPHFGLFARGDTVTILEGQLGFVRGVEFEVIEPGIDLLTVDTYDFQRDTIRKSLNISTETVVGITVARLISTKNIPFLIEGLERAVHNMKVPITWLMVGEGPERPFLEKLTKAKGLHGYIRWLGQVEHSEVHRLLAAADIFALTSAYESFSMATLEAMAHRLPVVATDVGYLKPLVRESGGGILISQGDVEGLAQAIVRLSNDADYRRQLGENGRAYVQRFDWPKIIGKLLRLHERVIAGRSGRDS